MKTRVLSLVKDGEEFVFRYEIGREDEVIDEILRHARDPRRPPRPSVPADSSLKTLVLNSLCRVWCGGFSSAGRFLGTMLAVAARGVANDRAQTFWVTSTAPHVAMARPRGNAR